MQHKDERRLLHVLQERNTTQKKMCQNRSSKRMRIGSKLIRLDSCITNLIFYLNRRGLCTVGSCCGHGRYNMTISYEKNNGEIWELLSNIRIPRKRRLYKKDKNGYYFIPEVVETC